MNRMVKKEFFCELSDGRTVSSYTITNRYGEYVTVLDYGATIHKIVVRDRNGNLGDVVLGADPEYFEACTYKGGTIGRCANRIGYGRCVIGGKTLQLEQNMMGHFLHGASGNYAQKLLTGEIPDGENKVVLHWLDGGDGGWDCKVQADFGVSFDDEGRLTLCLEMCGDGDTVLNPTNHAYFNLMGTGDVRDHRLWIGADQRVTRGEMGLPDGGKQGVAGTPADFTAERSIREALESDTVGYFRGDKSMFDEFYVYDDRKMRLAASLYCPETGREMKTYTDMPGLVLFCAGGRKPEPGKDGKTNEGYCAVCLETGFVPNAVNCTGYVSPVFRAGEKLTATTVYQFQTRQRED